jgi:hypothetical protein
MNVEDLKKEAATLDHEKQGELAAFLVSLRNARDPAYRAAMQERMDEEIKVSSIQLADARD